ncbi:MAG: formate/nitrite transporter family protein [Myxococcaceae bacterium]
MDREQSQPSEQELPFVRVTAPFRDELLKGVERIHLEPALIDQLQNRELAVGHVRVDHQLLVRLDVPLPSEGYGLDWQRLDAVVTSDFVLQIQPKPLRRLDDALSGAKAVRADRFFALFAQGIVAGFDDLRESLEHENEALRSGTSASKKALRTLHEDADELLRGMTALQQVLEALPKVHPFGASDAAELQASIAKLRALHSTVTVLRERLPPAPITAEEEVPLDVESPEIVETAIALGQKRLHRMTMGHMVTALIGGLAVSFGAAAMAWTAGPFLSEWGYEKTHLLGALAFPIGFVFLITGKGELFTENFFVPVSGVMSGNGKVKDLLSLWGSTLLFNLIGAVLFAFLVTRPGVLPEGALQFVRELGHHKVANPFGVSFMKGIFAGWLMTLLTWLLLASKDQGPRLFIISIVGFLIAAGQLNHVVISASECFMAIGAHSGISVKEWFFKNFLPALTGNFVGGIVFVTVLGYLQANLLKHSEERMKEAFHDQKRREAH